MCHVGSDSAEKMSLALLPGLTTCGSTCPRSVTWLSAARYSPTDGIAIFSEGFTSEFAGPSTTGGADAVAFASKPTNFTSTVSLNGKQDMLQVRPVNFSFTVEPLAITSEGTLTGAVHMTVPSCSSSGMGVVGSVFWS